MCYDRLIDEDTAETSVPTLLRSEWFCAVRNGALAAAMVLVVLLLEGTPAWLIAASVGGALALGAIVHQLVFLVGVGVVRAMGQWSESHVQSAD